MKKNRSLAFFSITAIIISILFVWVFAGCGGGSSGGDASPTATATSTIQPTSTPTSTPSSTPSSTPTVQPTSTPSSSPSPHPTMTSDFTPPSGADPSQSGYGPWNKRLLLATSADGLTFTRADRVVTDQADVPDVVQDGTGRIYLYYTGWTVGNEVNKTCVAISDDNGTTWAYKRVLLSGFENMADPVDPDVQILDDGTFRLYLTSDPNDGQGQRTYYAEGTDGISFTKKGVAFQYNGQAVLDPSTLKIGNTWHFFAGGVPQQNYHATSTDGKSFTYQGMISLTDGGHSYNMDNGINANGTYRYFCFYDLGANIKSFTSSDGATWTVESGNRLTADTSSGLESDNLVGVAVTRLNNGSYLMIYATVIP